MAASVTSALTEAQTATLSTIVRRLRCVLPDPSARDMYDTIAEQDQAMSVWASASRVKKVNTSHNKEVKHADYSRDGLEPDETNGPLVLDTLAKWPADTPVFFLPRRERRNQDLQAGGTPRQGGGRERRGERRRRRLRR
mmetsp:Transcript_9669/g.31968  ORF Transcript_9669/g.31968 Transcript_9669/m.31968 type:complete len:139 (-) Transcript_9669:681-1097(-)